MIKIGKYLYIHVLTAVLFAVCIINRNLFELLAVYSVMLLHEAAHLAAAVGIGLKVSHITLYPFGVNLRLRNKMVCSVADEIILYASGPLANALMALTALFIYRIYPLYSIEYFYISNTVLFFVNLLPACPLDGGIIVKKLLMHRLGSNAAQRVMCVISAVIALLLVILGIYAVYLTECNYSVLMLSVLVIGNVFTQKEKYNIDYIKELIFYKEKSRKKAVVKIANVGESAREISKRFDFGKYSVVFLLDKNGKIKNIETETEIIDKILNGK